MAASTAAIYRAPRWDPADALFRRCLTVSAVVAALFALAALFVPLRQRVIDRVEQLPPRFARLVLEPPKPAGMPQEAQSPAATFKAPPGGGGGGGGGEAGPTAKVIAPEPVAPAPPAVVPAPRRHALAPGAGGAGRERAQAVVRSTLTRQTASLTSALAGLSSSLGSSSADAPVRRGGGGRARAIRAARSAGEIGVGSPGLAVGDGRADLKSSVVVGSLVSIGGLSAGGRSSGTGGGSGGGSGGGLGDGTGDGVGSGSGGGTGGGSGGGVGTGTGGGTGPGSGGGGRRGAYAPGVYRSNASLLAVIQRYSAGIQYCYGNELKRDPSLRGKLVVALVVAASGEVLEATIVQNSVGSPRLAACALAQIRKWRFPAIPEGVTAFQAPFVFTPPS